MFYDGSPAFAKQAGVKLWRSGSVPLLVRILRYFRGNPPPSRPTPWYKKLEQSLQRHKQLIGGGTAGLGIGALLTYLLMRRKKK